MEGGLEQLQRRMAACVMRPLTQRQGMRERNASGTSTAEEAAAFIRPNDRLSSFERLEIYNRQYWFRLFSSFSEDFPGLAAVVGQRRFQTLMQAYLESHPSTSFSLRNLGSQLVAWLEAEPRWTAPRTELALGMAALEWAHIEAFDGAAWPRMTPAELSGVGPDSRLALQPYLRLVQAQYAVDDALLSLSHESGSRDSSSNSASTGHRGRRLRTLRSLPREQVWIAVHRYQDSVYYRRLGVEEFKLLFALRNGSTLGAAIDEAYASSAMPEEQQPPHLQSAFQHWASMGWFCSPPVEEKPGSPDA